ncbi:hypothetical protein M422DRAFT_254673 [Sphaerobolus stellatus SS14]|uniref:Uncharacterized protein n=1 Tax=Sphaerobolus stellatus (strain SS14) TaxID=990650 RepID=A0A0C9UGR9_SPHS4|nr:hypothetical protein M422DRAFT_254673 [Sphaerobolus stellatus SS14]
MSLPSVIRVAVVKLVVKVIGVIEKWAGRIVRPRNNRRAGVRLSLDPTSGTCDSKSDNVTSLDAADIARLEGGRAVLDVNATFDGTEDWTWRVALPNAGDACRGSGNSHPDGESGRKASMRPPTPISRSLAAVNANGTTSPSHKLITLHQICLRPTIELESRSFISPVFVRQIPSSDKSSMHTVWSQLTHLESGTASVDAGDTRLKYIPPVRQLLATLKLGVDP